MFFQPRPNRLTDTKDEAYHVNCARWALTSTSYQDYINFAYRGLINWQFYRGNQWILDEDLDPFLLDESGEVRNRIKFVQNIILNYVQYFRGTAIRMDVNGKVISTSRHSTNRKIQYMEKMRHLARVASTSNFASAAINKAYGIDEDEQEAMQSAQNLWVDEHLERINAFSRAMSDRNDFETLKLQAAEHMALDGLCVSFEDTSRGMQTFTNIDPKRFIWDRSARRLDLLDAQFMGDFWFAAPTELYEKYPKLTEADKQNIEKATAINLAPTGFHSYMFGLNKNIINRAPVYRIYWQDIDRSEWGCCSDDYGYPVLVKIEKNGRYTKKDLITPPDGFFEAELENVGVEPKYRNKSITIDKQQTRFCEYIEPMFIAGSTGDPIVLDFGTVPFQETHSYVKNFTPYPYKVWCWSLVDGEPMAPVDNIIDPQRLINRYNSMGEAQVNNSRGKGTIYDKDMVDSQGGEEEFLRKINMSQPIGVNAAGRLNNSVMSYDSNISNSTFGIMKLAQDMKGIADNLFGGGEALLGQGGGYRVSVGAVKQNLDQATTTQEPFFYGLLKYLQQMHHSIVNRGIKIALANPGQLAAIVGDDGVADFNLSPEMIFEEFGYELKASTNRQEEVELANQMILQLSSPNVGLIIPTIAANAYGNCDLADVGMLIRKSMAAKEEAAKQQEKADKVKTDAAQNLAAISTEQQNNAQDFAFSQQQHEAEKNRQTQLDAKALQVAGDMAKTEAQTNVQKMQQPTPEQ